MFSVISHWVVEVKAIITCHLSHTKMSLVEKMAITSTNEEVEKSEPSYIADGNIK